MNYISSPLMLRIIYFSIWSVIGAKLYFLGVGAGWSSLHVPAMSPLFADMRGVQASLHAVDIGLNPQIENPTDVLQRPLNYPSIWIYIARIFHLDYENNYLIFCSLIGISFILLCGNIFVKSRSIIVLPVLFSGASLLAVERGNNDLIIFSLLYIACNAPRIAGALAFTFSVGLKIYPLFGIIAFYKSNKLFIMLLLVSLVILSLLWPEIQRIKAATPIAYFLSYGSPSISSLISFKYSINISPIYISIILLSAALYLRLKKWNNIEFVNDAGDQTLRMFLTGAGIYIGTFIFNSNFDYRLIFLIFCLPFLMQIKNQILRLSTLLMIFLASNEWILEKDLAGSFGYLICLLAKIGIFIVLSNMLLDLFKNLFIKEFMPKFYQVKNFILIKIYTLN